MPMYNKKTAGYQSHRCLIEVPRIRGAIAQSRNFAYVGPSGWNRLLSRSCELGSSSFFSLCSGEDFKSIWFLLIFTYFVRGASALLSSVYKFDYDYDH